MLLIPMLCAAGIAFGQATTAAAPPQDLNPQAGPPMLGIHWARGFQPNARIANEAKQAKPAARRSPNMTYHGGKIMPTAVTKAVFWGTSWGSYSGDKISGMDLWYNGFNISNYAKTSDEYTGTNGQVTASTNHLGHIVDTSPSASGANTSTILAEVCRAIGTPDSSGNGYYAVYADTPAVIPFNLHTSLNLMATQAATRRTPQDCTRRVWLPSQMSAGTNSPKRAPIPQAQAPGMTPQVPRTVTNAHGRTAPHSSPFRTIPSGRSRENGPMPPTPPARAIPTVPVKGAASRDSSPQPGTPSRKAARFNGRPFLLLHAAARQSGNGERERDHSTNISERQPTHFVLATACPASARDDRRKIEVQRVAPGRPATEFRSVPN
jgi:hypothetical protein